MDRLYFNRVLFTGQVDSFHIIHRQIHVQPTPAVPDDTPIFYIDPERVVEGSVVEVPANEQNVTATMPHYLAAPLEPAQVEWVEEETQEEGHRVE